MVTIVTHVEISEGQESAWDGHPRARRRGASERTILVEQALALGEVKQPKTGQTRTVRLLAPLAADLAEWRLASGRPGPKSLVFPGRTRYLRSARSP
jgi:hypothetical protein